MVIGSGNLLLQLFVPVGATILYYCINSLSLEIRLAMLGGVELDILLVYEQ